MPPEVRLDLVVGDDFTRVYQLAGFDLPAGWFSDEFEDATPDEDGDHQGGCPLDPAGDFDRRLFFNIVDGLAGLERGVPDYIPTEDLAMILPRLALHSMAPESSGRG